ncbi:unnamed protein product [Cylicocyclus nassatus]|uniref:Uncharacterized protein n=1 Tax=Cylicocyclus nassatus TaxID=53992 RepID=A0AA36DR69_CYLNA|nr:unnamed protein product [Cylicocyclus nassatus]
MWIICSTLAITLLGIISGDSWINVLIGAVGMFYVSVYSTGTRGSFLLGVIYNIILIPIYIYSFIYWGKHNIKPRNMTKKKSIITLMSAAIVWVALFGLSKLLNGNYSLFDSLNTTCTLYAMILGLYGISLNWALWSVNNVVSALTFGLALATPTGSITVFAMKVIFMVNGLIGWYNFNRLGKTTDGARWEEHIYRASPTANQYIDRAINKYGKDNFTIEIIEDNINDEILGKREQYWIKYYGTYNNGYNLTMGGEEGSGLIKGIALYQWDLDGNFIAQWRSARDVENTYGFPHQDLIRCAKGDRISSYGFLWTFDDQPPVKRVNKMYKPVAKLSDNYDIIDTYATVKEGAEAIKRPASNISRAIRRHIKSGGFYWKYI